MPNHEHFELLADDELLRNVGEGCDDCFALLFHRYFRQVFCLSFRILRDRAEAEDILQEVFLAIFLHKESFDRSKGSVRTWVLQFAYFKSLLRRRYLRIRNFYRQEELAEQQAIRASAPRSILGLDKAEWTHFVEGGIAALGAKQRRTIELVHLEGYTLQEAADLQRESLANTRNYYYRGLKALRAFLEGKAELRRAEEKAALSAHAYRFEH